MAKEIKSDLVRKERKSLLVSPIAHKLLKDYCRENGLIIENFVDSLIKRKLKKHENN